jgi:hypothetical protein
VVSLIVKDDYLGLAAETPAHAPDHFVRRLRKRAGAPASEHLLRQFPHGNLLTRQEGVVVGNEDLGLGQLLAHRLRYDIERAVVIAGIRGQQNAQRSRMVMPGVTMRKASPKRESWGLPILFSVCQAISMAITTVLPEPIAILNAMRLSSGLCESLASFNCRRIHAPSCRSAISAK